MTSIAVLGAGTVARTLATGLAAAGHRVTVACRRPADIAQEWGEPDITVTALDDVPPAAVAINALPGSVALDVLRPLAFRLVGAVLLDVANAVHVGPDAFASALCHPGGSLAERLAAVLPDTAVVKSLNTLGPAELMTDPGSLTVPPTAFLSGDDPAAKRTVTGLLTDLGRAGEWIVDLGDLTTARFTESFILLARPLVAAVGPRPFGLTVAR